MEPVAAKQTLHRSLQLARDALVWKLDGLSEYDVRRPLTPTGTNLLGLVKHLAFVESGYLGDVFGRPLAEAEPDDTDLDANADMFARADESRAEVIARYRRANAHADATIEGLAIDATGTVPWWPAESNPVTLHTILVHLIAETHRHVGQADILREGLDGAVGHRLDVANLPDGDAQWWASYVARVEAAARAASST